MSKQPNFLFIITDQQRADHLGVYGNSIVSTPHIDSLGVAAFVRITVTSPRRSACRTARR